MIRVTTYILPRLRSFSANEQPDLSLSFYFLPGLALRSPFFQGLFYKNL